MVHDRSIIVWMLYIAWKHHGEIKEIVEIRLARAEVDI